MEISKHGDPQVTIGPSDKAEASSLNEHVEIIPLSITAQHVYSMHDHI